MVVICPYVAEGQYSPKISIKLSTSRSSGVPFRVRRLELRRQPRPSSAPWPCHLRRSEAVQSTGDLQCCSSCFISGTHNLLIFEDAAAVSHELVSNFCDGNAQV
jgi:hypothetical protein